MNNKLFFFLTLAVLIAGTFALTGIPHEWNTRNSHTATIMEHDSGKSFTLKDNGKLHFIGDKSKYKNGLIYGEGNSKLPSIIFHPETGEVQYVIDKNSVIMKFGGDVPRPTTKLTGQDIDEIKRRIGLPILENSANAPSASFPGPTSDPRARSAPTSEVMQQVAASQAASSTPALPRWGKYGMIAAAGAGTVLLGSLIGTAISNKNGDTSSH